MTMKKISRTGYKSNSKDKNEPSLIIPGNHLTMEGVNRPIYAVPNYGTPQLMYPGDPDFYFQDADFVEEYPMMKKGGSGIHIAKNKRGTFTAAATKHGKSVQAFAQQVLANKENYSPKMVKKANFARNSTKFKHQTGGEPPQYDDTIQYNNSGQPYNKEISDYWNRWNNSMTKDFYLGVSGSGLSPSEYIDKFPNDYTFDKYKQVDLIKNRFNSDFNRNKFREGGEAPQGESMDSLLDTRNKDFIDYLAANTKKTLLRESAEDFMEYKTQMGGPVMTNKQIEEAVSNMSGYSGVGDTWDMANSYADNNKYDAARIRSLRSSYPELADKLAFTKEELDKGKNGEELKVSNKMHLSNQDVINIIKNKLLINPIDSNFINNFSDPDKKRLESMYNYMNRKGEFQIGGQPRDPSGPSGFYPQAENQPVPYPYQIPTYPDNFGTDPTPLNLQPPQGNFTPNGYAGNFSDTVSGPYGAYSPQVNQVPEYVSQYVNNSQQTQQGIQGTTQQTNSLDFPDVLLAGTNGFNSFLRNQETARQERKLKNSMTIENVMPRNPSKRGDYDINTGSYRPDRMGYPTYKKGGSYEVDQTQLSKLLADGYKFEFVD